MISLTNPYAQEELKANIALMEVIDPELNINIIDMGLVYGVDFSEPQTITVTMTRISTNCPTGDAIEQGVINVLDAAFPNRQMKINLVWDPEWSIDNISEAGKERLGL